MTFGTIATWIFTGAICVTALIAFPFRRLALRIGMVDYPDSFRKLQKQPVPLGGGAVVFFVMTMLLTALILCGDQVGFKLGLSPKLLLPLMVVSPFIIMLGLIDDMRSINGKVKLLLQIIAASIVVGFAKDYSAITCFCYNLDLHHLFYPLAVFWIIGMINAVNLLDGGDGVAATVGFFMSLATACIAYLNGHMGISLVALGLAGCLLGFFLHNRPPAGIYLGDAGSMFIGLVLATLLLRACVEPGRTISISGPLAIALIPLADSLFAVMRRINAKRTIFAADRGHIHHLLSLKISSPYRVLLVLTLLVLPGCTAAVAGTYYRNDWIPITVSCAVLGVAFVTDLFGRRELFTAFGRIKARVRKTFHPKKYMRKNGEVYHLQGNGPWRCLWGELMAILKGKPCRCLQLNISIPFENEEFFGEWENIARKRSTISPTFDCRIPFLVDGQRVGNLRIVFETSIDTSHRNRSVLLETTAICETYIVKFLAASTATPCPLPYLTERKVA